MFRCRCRWPWQLVDLTPQGARHVCVNVDRKHRGQGIARAALDGALDRIAHLGSGLIEAISEVTTGREAQGRFLFSATVELFERNGFTAVVRSASRRGS
ncbi:MAG: hypothetical protein ACR2FF_09070 [Mycobacteriales bacterium]